MILEAVKTFGAIGAVASAIILAMNLYYSEKRDQRDRKEAAKKKVNRIIEDGTRTRRRLDGLLDAWIRVRQDIDRRDVDRIREKSKEIHALMRRAEEILEEASSFSIKLQSATQHNLGLIIIDIDDVEHRLESLRVDMQESERVLRENVDLNRELIERNQRMGQGSNYGRQGKSS